MVDQLLPVQAQNIRTIKSDRLARPDRGVDRIVLARAGMLREGGA
jgi:hypothetical protein